MTANTTYKKGKQNADMDVPLPEPVSELVSEPEPDAPPAPSPLPDPRESGARFLCTVHRLNTERENSDLPISVHLIGKKRRVFLPGENVVLYDYHIDILRNAVEDNEIELAPESAVYEAKDPLKSAEQNFPGFRARMSEEDGSITLVKRIPMYSVEVHKKINP